MKISTEIEKSAYSDVWVLAETLSGKIQPVTHELIGAARALADARKSQVCAVVMRPDAAESLDPLFFSGADKAVVVTDPRFSFFIDEIEARIAARLIEKYKPEVILCAATSRGRALIPRIAVLTTCGLTADCTGLAVDPENGDLLQTRPAFGGNIMATIRCSSHRPQMASVRPRVMRAPQQDKSRSGTILTECVTDADLSNAKEVLKVFHSSETAVNLADARIILSGGRGMKGKEGFDLLRRLAAQVGGAVGASRAAVDAGWIPYAHQVGQTGQTVQTKVYIACGISGQIQHLVGMQSCDLIVAIDKNPNTPMMQLADIAVVGDLFEILPELIRGIPLL